MAGPVDCFLAVALAAGLAGAASAAPAPSDRGRVLAEQGVWSLQVPPCAGCHGPAGTGVGAATPPLAGRSAAELLTQLNRFRDNQRRDEALGLMNGITQRLSPEDLKAAADYYAALPTPAPEAKP